MEVEKEKDVNTINANDILETEDTGANADDTSNKGTMRKKARKERNKARRDKRAREQDKNTHIKPQYIHPRLDYEGRRIVSRYLDLHSVLISTTTNSNGSM